MCNIPKPVEKCSQCFKAVKFEHLPQPCIQIANPRNSQIGAGGTLTSQKVSGPRDRVSEDCYEPAQRESDVRNDSRGEARSYPPYDYRESSLPEAEMTAHCTVSQQSTLATTPSEAERHVRERRAKYRCPSETNNEDAEDDPSSVDTPAALSRSRAQPPLLQTVLAVGAPRVHTPTPQSATSLRIESPWNTESELPRPRNDPWWYPEIWGPARDLPADLAGLLRRLAPADTFHNHWVYVFYDDNDDNKEPLSQATVLLATPDGARARVVSGALYDEGARLVARRHLARAQYEELSAEEREKLAKGEQCCIYYPCSVASCPLLHRDGQHQPAAPEGETLLAAMGRGYAWRKDWGTRIPRPVSPVSRARRYGGSRSPPRQRSPGAAAEERRGPAPSGPTTTAGREVRTEAWQVRGRPGWATAPRGARLTNYAPVDQGRPQGVLRSALGAFIDNVFPGPARDESDD